MSGYNVASLSGWGNYPVHRGHLFRPESVAELADIVGRSSTQPNYISHGLGRSYGDPALNDHSGVIGMRRLNRMLSFDASTRVLHCEAGVSLEEIIDTFLPRGYFLPVTPGTRFVTVGGAIANDVHGKNHHVDGCFSAHVLELELLLASGATIRCSRSEHADIFWATVGGIGLTGIIVSASLRLIAVETAYYDVVYEKAADLDKALELFGSSDAQFQYSVAWIDGLAGGRSLGRCVLMRANHATREQVKGFEPLRIKARPKLRMPMHLPSAALNRWSIGLFNAVYYGAHSNENKIVDYESFFYPLDAIHHWNRLYGKKGFVQYQVVFPLATAREGIIALLGKLNKERQASFLAVLKSTGEQGEGLLSFPKKGYTLALDIPVKHTESLRSFLATLDQLILKYEGRLYTGKDAALSGEHFAIMYPRLKQFQQIKRRIDPNQLFSSSMARRLNIVEAE